MKDYPETHHPKIEDILEHDSSVDKSIEKIKKAIEFHTNNNYPGKIPNISAGGIKGALNKALQINYGFKLDKAELNTAYRETKSQKKSLGICI